MTRTTNARVAGAAFLLYIAVYVVEITVFAGVTTGDEPAVRLAAMAQNATDVRIDLVLGLFTCFLALTLGVTLWALTRDQDRDLAMLGLVCRVGEGLIGAMYVTMTFGLLTLATSAGADAPDAAAVNALSSFVLTALQWNPVVAASYFTVGSMAFSWLLLRGRLIPVGLAWLGVVASVLALVVLPLQLAGYLGSPVTDLIWIPMAAFEIALALWLLIKGAKLPQSPTARSPTVPVPG